MIIRSKKPMQRVYVTPTDYDVLLGRGIHNFKHAGNISLRSKIVAKLEEYSQCERRGEKTNVIRGVIADVNSHGGRFLKLDRNVERWYDGGHEAAKIRVGVAFRDANIPNKVKFIEKARADLRLGRGNSTETGDQNTSIEDTNDDSSFPSPVPSVAAATLPSVVHSGSLNHQLLAAPPRRSLRHAEQSSSIIERQLVALQHSNIGAIEAHAVCSDVIGSEHDFSGVATAASSLLQNLPENSTTTSTTRAPNNDEKSHDSNCSSESIFSDELLDSIEGIDDQFPKWESIDD